MARKTAKTAKSSAAKTDAVKARIKSAGAKLHEAVDSSETMALNGADRVETALRSAADGWTGVKTIGAETADAIGTSGRASVNGVLEMSNALVGIAKETANETIDLGKKSMQAGCLKELVSLHTDFASHRINQTFEHINALSGLAQRNMLDAWSPLANLLRQGSVTIVEGSQKAARGVAL